MQSGLGQQKSHIKGVIDRRRRQQEDIDIHERVGIIKKNIRSSFVIEEEVRECHIDHRNPKGLGGDCVYHHTSIKKDHETAAMKMMGSPNVGDRFATIQVNDIGMRT
jgi:hypothetical protein